MADYDTWTVDELQDELRDRDLKVSGTKEELVSRLEDHDAEDDRSTGDTSDEVDGDEGRAGGGDRAPKLREVVEGIRGDFAEVTGLEAEQVTGLAQDGDGWRARVDVVEISRVPPSTDVLATYEVTTDRDGNLGSFERVRRFRRSEGTTDD